jgi:hypothetical protein
VLRAVPPRGPKPQGLPQPLRPHPARARRRREPHAAHPARRQHAACGRRGLALRGPRPAAPGARGGGAGGHAARGARRPASRGGRDGLPVTARSPPPFDRRVEGTGYRGGGGSAEAARVAWPPGHAARRPLCPRAGGARAPPAPMWARTSPAGGRPGRTRMSGVTSAALTPPPCGGCLASLRHKRMQCVRRALAQQGGDRPQLRGRASPRARRVACCTVHLTCTGSSFYNTPHLVLSHPPLAVPRALEPRRNGERQDAPGGRGAGAGDVCERLGHEGEDPGPACAAG